MKKRIPGSNVSLHGFTRVMLKKAGDVVGDSGWLGPNMIVDGGVQQFIMNGIASTTGGLHVGAIAIGTGGTTASDATIMAGEYGGTAKRKAVTVATTQRAASNGTATLEFSAVWSSANWVSNSNISNIGLFDVSNAQGSLFAANVYTSSTWNSNQDLYASYQIRISFS